MRSLYCLILTAFLSAAISLNAAAAPINFVVQTQAGEALSHAVISSGAPVEPGDSKAMMDQVDKTFVPYVLAVPVGTAVSFPNSDQIRHHVYSFSEPKSFELRLYSGIPEEPIVFDKAGVVVVGCNIHDNMVGYIYVSPRQSWSITDRSGLASLDVDSNTLFVWHPGMSLDAQQELGVDFSSLDEDDTGRKIIRLDIALPDPYPQAVRSTDRDKFKRYLAP